MFHNTPEIIEDTFRKNWVLIVIQLINTLSDLQICKWDNALKNSTLEQWSIQTTENITWHWRLLGWCVKSDLWYYNPWLQVKQYWSIFLFFYVNNFRVDTIPNLKIYLQFQFEKTFFQFFSGLLISWFRIMQFRKIKIWMEF